MKEKPTYRELLEDSFPEKSSPLYHRNADYAFTAIERGTQIVDIMEKHVSIRGSRVLDLGCGEGGVAIAFALRGGQVTALDASPERIERMKVWASEHGVAVEGVAGDALETGLPSGHYDVVVCNDFLEHVRAPQALAYEIQRLLKEGGHLYLSNLNRLSIFGFLSDPHLSLFGLTWMPRWLAKIYAEKIRRRTESYSVFVIPTHGYLKRIFGKAGVELTSITSENPAEKILNPHLIKSGPKRRAMLAARKLGLTWIAFRLLDSRLNQLFLDMLTYVGKKRA
ncbi:MAG: Methyltransferase type 11 [Dehalococcoidia bacterium]|nr:Methyltransferase type 11 [Dehalococcoidia bacterium]